MLASLAPEGSTELNYKPICSFRYGRIQLSKYPTIEFSVPNRYFHQRLTRSRFKLRAKYCKQDATHRLHTWIFWARQTLYQERLCARLCVVVLHAKQWPTACTACAIAPFHAPWGTCGAGRTPGFRPSAICPRNAASTGRCAASEISCSHPMWG